MKTNLFTYFIAVVLSFFFIANIKAQIATIAGVVKNEKGSPLIGVNIVLLGTATGTSSNHHGEFKFSNVKIGEYQLEVSMVGYKKFTSGKFLLDSDEKSFEITLEETSLFYNQVIVTAGKHRQDISELPVSASLIDSKDLTIKNYFTLDKAMRYVPGVNITLDQISIRGSSGYSRGAGTRVLVAMDGIPIFSGDTGEIIWDIIPITDLERIEIIKGASSSLYGSNAIGGVVNVITKDIASLPVTYLYSYGGVYDKPSHDEWDWSEKYRTFNGLTLSHTNSIDKLGYSISLSRVEDNSYRQSDWFKRYTGFLKTKYYFNDKLALTFIATGLKNNRGTFNYWKDSRHALVPPDDDQGDRTSSERFMFGLIFENVLSENFSYSFKGSLYRNLWKDESESANRSNSTLYRGELQTNYQPNDKLQIITGAEINFAIVSSNIFQNPTSNGFGIYSQFEMKMIPRIIITMGARYDYNKLDTLESDYSFSPKFGLNYKASDKTTLRFSIAKGFRAPSLAEAFTSTVTSGVTVKPNPKVKSETNYSFEVGMNTKLTENLDFDLAVFQSEYYDLIEPKIDPADGKIIFDNVTRATIQGLEAVTRLLIPELNSSMNFGYTILWARDIEMNRALKYRPRHMLYFNYEWSPSIYNFSFDFRFGSKVEEIDFELIDLGLVKDGDKRVEVGVFDLSAGARLFSLGIPANLYLNIKNLF
ncbi:MAG: TonB-dependent receptor, partial [bacterium]